MEREGKERRGGRRERKKRVTHTSSGSSIKSGKGVVSDREALEARAVVVSSYNVCKK
jgi:hypothetical protein